MAKREGFHQHALELGLRLQVGHIRGEDGGLTVMEFRVVEEDLGAQAMAKAVAGGVGFATGSDGSTGFCAIGAGGGGTAFGDHTTVLCARGLRVLACLTAGEFVFSLLAEKIVLDSL